MIHVFFLLSLTGGQGRPRECWLIDKLESICDTLSVEKTPVVLRPIIKLPFAGQEYGLHRDPRIEEFFRFLRSEASQIFKLTP